MEWIGGVVLLFALSIVGGCVRARQGEVREKRTYLFETEAGERDTPFGEFADGASDSSPTCRQCLQELSSEHYHYCVSCFPAD